MAIRFYGVDDSQVDVTEKKSTSLNDKTGWFYGPDYEYTEVSVTNAEILAMGSTPVSILPAPGANSYYEYYGVLESVYDTTAYTLAADLVGVLRENSYSGGLMAPGVITQSANAFAEFASNGPLDPTTSAAVDYYGAYRGELNEGVVLTTLNGTDPTLGDGTILVKIWYKVKTFGTEL